MKKRLLCGVCVCLLSVGSGMAQTQRSMTIDQLFSLIESGSNVLTAQKTGVDVASRAVEEAKSKRLPDINASLSASYNGNVLMTDRDFTNAKGFSQPHFGNSFALEAQQVVYAGGAINSGIRLAELNRVEQEQGHRLSQNKAAIDVAQAQINLARLNLSYTVITATADGVVGKKNIHVGQLVQPGQAMVDIVDNSELWVVANYRETQLPGISLGAKVSIKADAVSDVEFEGTVERISDATGSAFSVIPQDNATGNFVKVEQRIPVRIRLEGDKTTLARLRAGMNVECTVNK